MGPETDDNPPTLASSLWGDGGEEGSGTMEPGACHKGLGLAGDGVWTCPGGWGGFGETKAGLVCGESLGDQGWGAFFVCLLPPSPNPLPTPLPQESLFLSRSALPCSDPPGPLLWNKDSTSNSRDFPR